MNVTGYMNGTTKVLVLRSQAGSHQTVVGRLKYGGQIERRLLYRRFVHERDDVEQVRWNFIALSTQTFADPPCVLAHSSDTDETFDRKLAALLDLDDDVVEAWLVGVGEMAMPLVDRAQLPAALLTEAEQKDPNSDARGRRQRKASDAR